MTTKFSNVSGKGFDSLLRAFDPDPQKASARYEVLRRKLVWFFERKGSGTPEDQADETLTRLARKLEEGERIHGIETYALGVARFVRLEARRANLEVPLDPEMPERAAVSEADDSQGDERVRCMQRCLASFPASERDLILTYYLGERRARIDARKALAERLGIPVTALRIRAFRIRQRLQACVTGCVQRLERAMQTRLATVPDIGHRIPHERA